MIPITPPKKLVGEIRVPGDKSISHRVLIFAALADGISVLTGLSTGADVASTLRILRQFGTKFQIQPQKVKVEGTGYRGLSEPQNILNCGNSGTTARLMCGVLAGQNIFSVLSGDSSLLKRPMKRIVEPLQKMGAEISGRQNDERLPLAIRGKNLTAIEYSLPVASAQLKTALLLAGLFADGETVVREPAQSRDHTERLMKWLELPLRIRNLSYHICRAEIPGFSFHVPGDSSSAAYFIALGLLHPNAHLIIREVNLNPTRCGFLQVLQQMGAQIKIESKVQEPEPVGDIVVSSSFLQNLEIDQKMIPLLIDELPLLAVVATQARGRMVVRGAQELRVKESDRIKGIVSRLRRMEANIEELADGFIVEGPTRLHGARLQANKDHRIAMSLSVAALIAEGQSSLFGDRWISISFPEFFQIIKKISEGSK